MNRLAFAFLFALMLSSDPISSQTTSAAPPINVSAFPGSDIGAKTASAMAACNPNPAIPCVLVLDAPLAGAPSGQMPALCPQCSVQDQRPADPTGKRSALLPANSSVLDARYYGADPTGLIDSTPALLRAATDSCLPSREVEPVLLSPGTYHLANLDLSSLHCAPYFETPNDQSVQFIYNGTGAPGDYLIKLPNMSFGGFRGIYFNGQNPQTGALATYGVWLSSGIDNGFWIQRSRFANFLSHAIYQSGSSFTNWHMDHLRFDAVGGCGVYLSGANGNDGQPFSMTDFTLDNHLPGGLATQWLAANHIGNGINWGDAVVCVNNGTGIFVDLEDARIEGNAPQIVIGNNDNAALVREWNTRPGQALTVNVYSISTAGSTLAPPLVASANGQVHLTISGSGAINTMACIKNVATQTYYGDKYCTEESLFSWGYNTQQEGGISLGAAGAIPTRIESVSDSALPGSYARYHAGDILLRPDSQSNPGIQGPLRWVTAPLIGACQTVPRAIATDAVITAGNPTISFGPGTTITKLQILPGDNISLDMNMGGADASGGKFATRIASVSYADNAITVSPAPPASASSAHISWLPCTVHELPGAQSAAAPPSSGTWATGERVWNTNIAPGQATFWACAAGGTPCRKWVSGPAYGPAVQ
jgi:hypothetical protein